ncbi:unnamed protein product [Soboliphyme baturini]|uniref:Secreted protein n=1 Tax=Soboliphyme baturini TaxID=241478 RepID=A0A183IBF9_9BILA|nr:unnamed protein product [Soboliphyme baturini]
MAHTRKCASSIRGLIAPPLATAFLLKAGPSVATGLASTAGVARYEFPVRPRQGWSYRIKDGQTGG